MKSLYWVILFIGNSCCVDAQVTEYFGNTDSVLKFKSNVSVVWRADTNLPVNRMQLVIPVDSMESSTAQLWIEYTRMHREVDSFPNIVSHRIEDHQIIFESFAHESYLNQQLLSLYQDAFDLPLDEKKLKYCFMRLEKQFDAPRTATDWFLDQEWRPVVWNDEVEKYQKYLSYKNFRKTTTNSLKYEIRKSIDHRKVKFIGIGSSSVDSVLDRVHLLFPFDSIEHSVDTIGFEGIVNVQEYKFPCDTHWVTLQEDAPTPLVVWAWIWPEHEVSDVVEQQINDAIVWVKSPISTVQQEWVGSSKLYQLIPEFQRSNQQAVLSLYAFPRIDLVQQVQEKLPSSFIESLNIDWETLHLLKDQQNPALLLEEDPSSWMKSKWVLDAFGGISGTYSVEYQDKKELIRLISKMPCVQATLINSRHAREAGLEPNEEGDTIMPVIAEIPPVDTVLAWVMSQQTKVNKEVSDIPTGVLEEWELYFDSRYPEVRDQRLILLEEVLEMWSRYPNSRLEIRASVLNRNDHNAVLIGKMWAEYIRDYIQKEKRISSERMIPVGTEPVLQKAPRSNWDRIIRFELVP